MSNVTLVLAPELVGKSKEELSKVLDQEVDKFSEYMAGLGDWKSRGHLITQERALIKTYLISKIKETA